VGLDIDSVGQLQIIAWDERRRRAVAAGRRNSARGPAGPPGHVSREAGNRVEGEGVARHKQSSALLVAQAVPTIGSKRSTTRRGGWAMSSACELSGFWTAVTVRPAACRRVMTGDQGEPSAYAPSTRTMLRTSPLVDAFIETDNKQRAPFARASFPSSQ